MYCNKCGNKLIDGATFCTVCGEKVGIVHGMANKKKNGKKNNIVVVILLILMNLALIACAVCLVWKYVSIKNEVNDYEEFYEMNDENELDKEKSDDEDLDEKEFVDKPEDEDKTILESVEEETISSKLPVNGVQMQYYGMEGTIQQLIDRNINFNLNIYHFGSLPTIGAEVGYNLKQVDPYYFSNYNEYVTYVHSIYKEERADRIIENAKYFRGDNGELLLNTAFGLTATEYNIDWSCYVIEIVSQTNNECEFIVTAREKKNAQNQNPKDYEITGRMILENGKWVLEAEVY